MKRKTARQTRTPSIEQPPLRKRATWFWCAAILAVAFSMRLGDIFSSPAHRRVLRGFETQAVADSLRKTGKFANPFRYETGPTAHLAPAYPLFLSGLMFLSGDEAEYETRKEVLSALAASIQYALLPVLAILTGLEKRTGIVAGWLSIVMFAVLPENVRPLETQGSWENTYAALGIVGLSMLAASTLRQRRYSMKSAAAWGVGWGLYLLLIPAMAPVYAAWIVVGLVVCDRESRLRYLRFAGCAMGFLLVSLAPWTIRNVRVLGAPVWGRSNLGLELYVSNNDCAAATFTEMYRTGCHAKTHPNANPAEAQRMRELGEVKYNDQRMADALGWMRGNPVRFARLTAERFFLFWFPEIGPGTGSYLVWTMTVLGWAGVVLAYRPHRFTALLFGSLLVAYPVIYYFVQHFLRYRYPVLWVSSIMAAYGLTAAWERLGLGGKMPVAAKGSV